VWNAYFIPNLINQTSFQIWIQLHGLTHEYWRPLVILDMAGAIGVPLSLDLATMKRTFGRFA